MRIVYVTLCDDNRREISDATLPTLEAHCERKGYQFTRFTSLLDKSLHAVWNKFPAVLTQLSISDWTIWVDADIVITNPDFDFAKYVEAYPEKNLLISTDYNGICSGFMAFRNCDWSFKLMETLMFLKDVNDKVGKEFGWGTARFPSDQDPLKVLIGTFPAIEQKVLKIPETIVTNDGRGFVPSAFAMHYWVNFKDLKPILEKIEKLKTKGWSKDCV